MRKIVLLFLFVAAHEVLAQTKIDSSVDLQNWLPTNLLGFVAEADSYNAELMQDNAPYFVAAKKYAKGNVTMSIVVFDYRKPSERLLQTTNAWVKDKVSNDEGIYSANVMIAECKAQEFIDKNKKTSQLYLYHHNRYLITISSTTEDAAFLKTVAENLQPTRLSQ